MATNSRSMRSAEGLPPESSLCLGISDNKSDLGESKDGGGVPKSPCEHEVRAITLCSAKVLTQFRRWSTDRSKSDGGQR